MLPPLPVNLIGKRNNQLMKDFKGFSGKTGNIQVPPEFFRDVLPELDDINEIKLVLILFWYLQSKDENSGYILVDDLLAEPLVKSVFDLGEDSFEPRLRKALGKAVSDHLVLLGKKENCEFLFLNSPRGAALYKGLLSGEWQPDAEMVTTLPLPENRPNIFSLYEQNIGLITPLMAETLIEAERTYPVEWIEEAVKIAVERNARNWRFIDAILRSWKEKGRNEKDQRSAAESRKRDSEGEFSDFIRH
jgi:DnaD/phage-associated family protein